MMVEMQCGMCGAVWNACCGIVRRVIYILMWRYAWRGARWNVSVMWNGVPRCGGAGFDVNNGAMWNVAILHVECD